MKTIKIMKKKLEKILEEKKNRVASGEDNQRREEVCDIRTLLMLHKPQVRLCVGSVSPRFT